MGEGGEDRFDLSRLEGYRCLWWEWDDEEGRKERESMSFVEAGSWDVI